MVSLEKGILHADFVCTGLVTWQTMFLSAPSGSVKTSNENQREYESEHGLDLLVI